MMNQLWLEYITILLAMRPGEAEKGLDVKDCSVQTNLCSKLTKADFSGAHVTVVNAKN
jgi:hypothetical protein